MSQMSSTKFSALDLLDLPPLEREIFLHLARHGPVTVDVLASETGHDLDAVQSTVEALVGVQRLHVLDDGRIDVVLGRVSRRTTIPAVLWPAIATDRPYTRQEIATLRTAIPILQFARARMSQFADHGPGHAMRVRSYAVQLSYLIGLTATERHLLRIGALFHDVGNVVERQRHHIISQETVKKLAANGELPFSADEAEIIGLLCRWHRKEYDPDRVDELHGEPVRTGLLASVLRVADAMDIDHRRSDYDDRFRKVLQLFFSEGMQYWTSLEEIAGVRIRCTPAIALQVFTWGDVTNNMQVEMLRRDLGQTPLLWSIEQVAVSDLGTAPPRTDRVRALLVFPFDAHSLVMAALSRAHLAVAGYDVELLCYPDAPDAAYWLWTDGIADREPDLFSQLVVIGDRPDPEPKSRLLEAVGHWRNAGATVSVLNRFEANWSRLPELSALGADVTVGGDWAYFWGDSASRAEIAWTRIAALCVRDPTLALGAVSPHEYAVSRGLQQVVYKTLTTSAPDDEEGWRSRAELILARIEADEQAFFADQAGLFSKTWAAGDSNGHVLGKVIVFEQAPGAAPQAFPWILEAAIEREGRAPDRGIRFNVPHAIVSWPDGDFVEVLAITHWREEDALPIRLLYPEEVGPAPQGNEHALSVRIPTELAPVLLRTLIDACNRS
jgi:hypothetical protein